MDSGDGYNLVESSRNRLRRTFFTETGGRKDGNTTVTFEELLAFITGADIVPPCGFSKAIDVSFYPVERGVYRIPHVSTCSLELYLPRGVDDIQAFRELMFRALKESLDFEKI